MVKLFALITYIVGLNIIPDFKGQAIVPLDRFGYAFFKHRDVVHSCLPEAEGSMAPNCVNIQYLNQTFLYGSTTAKLEIYCLTQQNL